MKTFKVLVYEDDSDWVESFEFNLRAKLQKEGINLVVQKRTNDASCTDDLDWGPKLILIDYDLGELTAEDIIGAMEGHPSLVRTSIFLYSGGESIYELMRIRENFDFGISCFIKEGDSLENAVIAQGRIN